MAYNKNAKISINAILSGSAALEAVRGTGTWGAGYVFGSGGLTNDIKVLSDTFKNFSTSGSFATDAELAAVSGYITTQIASGPFASGSFTKLTVATDIVSAASGIATVGSKFNPIRASGLYMRAANNNTVWALCIQADGTVSGVPA
jgi:hypothetical protein